MNDFSRSDIESLKANTDLVELMRSYGIELKPVGRNLTAICPWHDDKDASLVVNPEKQLYNCFGCDAKGDVLNFLQAQEQLSFPQAVMRLKESAGDIGEATAPQSPAPSDPDRFEGGHTRNQLLEKVCEHYQLGLEGSKDAREYLQKRKLWDSELYEGFRFGYCDGSLLKAIPKVGSLRDALKKMGVLNSKNKEHFLGCVVAPLFHPADGLVGFYGRRLNQKAKVRHLFLPGPKRAAFGHQALEGSKYVYLAEGVLDALSLWIAGLRPVTCAFGTGGLPEELEKHLRASSVTELRLCFDSDRAGSKATEQICEQVGDRFKLTQVLLPDGSDPNDVLVREGRDVLRSFAQCLKPLVELGDLEMTDPTGTQRLPLTETTDTGFRLTFEEPPVIYQVTPQPPFNSSRLKITLRAERQDPDGRGRPLKYLDRADLVSSRSRSETLRGISQNLSLDKETAELHLSYILDTSEDFVSSMGLADGDSGIGGEAPVLTESEKLEALEFLRAPDLVSRLQDDMEALVLATLELRSVHHSKRDQFPKFQLWSHDPFDFFLLLVSFVR